MKPPRANQARLVIDWNQSVPMGTPVTYYKLRNPLREPQPDVTSSEAWLLGGHTAVVLVHGVSGAVALENLVVDLEKEAS